jgi:hypothetical protein
LESLLVRLRETSARRWVLYLVVYCAVGGFLQFASPHLRIAAFRYDWQVLTLYGLFLVPLSILLRDRPWHVQYVYAVVAIAPVDIGGFALGTSIAYPGNIIEHVFGPRSFTLVFVVCAGWIPLVGNRALARLEELLFARFPRRLLVEPFRGEVMPLASLDAGGANEAPVPTTVWQ